MRHMIMDYALESKSSDGKPGGVFKMDKKNTMAAGKEVIGKFKNLKGKELDSYMKQYFARTWEHFDVNGEGKLETLDMPAFMKYLASDQGIDLDS